MVHKTLSFDVAFFGLVEQIRQHHKFPDFAMVLEHCVRNEAELCGLLKK